jgi:molecular chaperone GrpE (heat shock protein)
MSEPTNEHSAAAEQEEELRPAESNGENLAGSAPCAEGDNPAGVGDMPTSESEETITDEWSVAAQQLIDEANTTLGNGANAVLTDEQRIAQLEELIAERTDDLQRLQAEYVNYKRRVDRDRAVAKQQGIDSVVKQLVPVVDTVATARENEEITGGFKAVADELDKLAASMGLTSFGTPGDEFDPNQHEALLQIPTVDFPPMSIAQVIQRGYKLGDAVLRPARVAVAVEPAE